MRRKDIELRHVYKNVSTGQIGVPFHGARPSGSIALAWVRRDDRVPMIYQVDKDAGAPCAVYTDPKFLEPYKLQPEDLLTDEHITSVCKPGTEDACRYFSEPLCLKVGSSNMEAITIDLKVSTGKLQSIGNNCSGRYNPDFYNCALSLDPFSGFAEN